MQREYTSRKEWTVDEIKYLKLLNERNILRKVICEKLGRSYCSVTQQIRKMGFSKDGTVLMHGHVVTPEQLEISQNNNIALSTLRNRIDKGMSVEEAINKPPRKQAPRNEEDFSNTEVIKILGRIKYMRQEEAEHPLPYPRPMLKRLNQQGLSVEDIDPVKVGEA